MVSKRIQEMPFSSIRKLTPFANQAKKEGKSVYHLNIGAPDVLTPKDFFQAIKEADVDVLSYSPSQGIPELLEANAQYFQKIGLNFTKDDLVITNGGSEALLFSLLATTDVGDQVLTCEPFYTNYKTFFHEVGVSPTTFPTDVKEGFALPAREVIEKAITDKTKVILISNPGNPTGAVYSKEEVRLLGDIAKDHDLFILADEVYREFIYDGKEFTSFASFEDLADRVIVLDSISKRFSACGARIGCTATKNKAMQEALVKLATGRLACPYLEQVGAVALYQLPDDYFDQVREEYTLRRNCIEAELAKIPGVVTSHSTGAFYIIADLPVEDAEDFARFMLTDFQDQGETVMMAPAAGFYQNTQVGKSQVRLAYVLESEKIARACQLIGLALEEYKKR